MTKNLTFWVVIAAISGYCGALWFGDPLWVDALSPPAFYELLVLMKSSFLALLKMLVAPIIFFSLIGGLLHIGDAARLRSLGSITILYYLATTFIAICIGLTMVFFVHPWVGNVERITVETVVQSGNYMAPAQLIDTQSGSLTQVFKQILLTAFTNPFSALANLNILAIATNAFLIGLAMLLVVPNDSPLIKSVHHINIFLHKILSWVILVTPFGIFAIIFDVTLKSGGTLVNSLLGFCAVVVGGTLIHGLIVLPLIGKVFAGMNIRHFFSKAAKPLMVAFATSSSSATLPISMQTAEEELGVSDTVTSFVFPLGATMNMDGTALYEGIAAVFLAYLFGIDLNTIGMVTVFFMAMMSSIGAPGMPSGSMAGMQMVLLGAGIPLEAIGILLVVERPLDTIRTAVNVEGDMIGALVTQRFFERSR
ncbi:MAG: dicarboxylate/amino acid:cation symporter [Gammaproteobacteria bacterium]|nr:dicarboxylate/amino acid:cation symporter [Gammaproteobacteria bacterium]MCP4090763.1 dicarboxylate/amino acid:cation symporter [Gammaproteobacteria bacterium]MCP4277190.1 dicarboxylate/amino acid:cation symporter [Gammaproteobacteria bacterium]MCP4832812.1 dicarboxylate/amino acid:cation symporter [Gammaproteobacteria bacterium]MCP4928000.1 dicarboxylate/amino acid:cation symporter [Gammaproteobacteria bacterium]